MKLTFLGTCAGTEPMPGRKHVSFVIEEGGNVYWFDAGEGCARTAHLGGVDLLRTSAVFVSHPHIDHLGGIPLLVFHMKKLSGRAKADGKPNLAGKRVDFILPRESDWEPLRGVMNLTSFLHDLAFDLHVRGMSEGEVFRDENMRVTALPNRHMGEPAPGEGWPSYSFRIETPSGTVVYTGDVADVAEIEPILDPCNLVLVETGHHAVEDIADFFMRTNARVERIGFIHHGRAILADPGLPARVFRERSMPAPLVTEDGMTLKIT